MRPAAALSPRARQILEADPVPAALERARTPSAAFYLDEELFEWGRERVFARSWQWLADEAEFMSGTQALGALPKALLPGCLDEPLVLTRAGGQTRCLSNLCTHRARPIVDRPTASAQLKCSYHGRRFDPTGRLLSAPGFEGCPEFPGPEEHLAELPLERRGPWWFASLAPAQPFASWFWPLDQRLSHIGLERARHAPERDRDFEFQAHWALYVENYLEGLHIPFIHPGLNQELDFKAYGYELLQQGVLQLGEARPGSLAFEIPAGHPDHGRALAAWYFWLFPNLMVNVYPWGISLNRIEPLAPDRTRVRFRSFVLEPSLLGTGAGGDLDQVEREDERAIEAVQRGLNGRLHRPGRYAPLHDQGVHRFHRLWQAALADPA